LRCPPGVAGTAHRAPNFPHTMHPGTPDDRWRGSSRFPASHHEADFRSVLR
jgi:hypothetical protein